MECVPPEQQVTIEEHPISMETADGLTLRGSRLLGPGRPKAAVVLAHGYAEHAGRYDVITRVLAASRDLGAPMRGDDIAQLAADGELLQQRGW